MQSGGPSIDGRFSLTDHHGQKVTERDYRGKYVLVFFGFTHCKMVCPRALGRLSSTLDRLGDTADTITPLYITVDPERDRPEVMRAFLEDSYPRFTGLTGSSEEIDAAKNAFRVFAAKKADPDGYQMPHSAFTFLLNPDGDYVAHYPDAIGEDELLERLRAAL